MCQLFFLNSQPLSQCDAMWVVKTSLENPYSILQPFCLNSSPTLLICVKKKRSCEQIVDVKPGNFHKIIHYAKNREREKKNCEIKRKKKLS